MEEQDIDKILDEMEADRYNHERLQFARNVRDCGWRVKDGLLIDAEEYSDLQATAQDATLEAEA